MRSRKKAVGLRRPSRERHARIYVYRRLVRGAAAWAAAAMVLVGMLGSAALSGPARQDVRLTIAHTSTGGPAKDLMDRAAAAFMALYPNVRVDQIVQDDDTYEDLGLITLLQSDRPPDIFFQWGGALVARDARLGHAADLTEALEQGGWKHLFAPAAWSREAGTTVDGRVYMIPDSFDVTNVIWYNRTIFRRLGLSAPSTWDELVSVAGKLRAAGVTPFVIGNKELWPFGNWAAHVVARVAGHEDYDAAFRLEKPFYNPGFLRAFRLIEQLAKVNAFNPDMPTMGADPAMINFFNGRAAMHPIGSWLVPTALDAAPRDFDYDFFNTPQVPDGKGDPTSVIGLASGFEVSARSRHFEEAVSFLRFLTGSLELQRLNVEAGSFSPIRGAMEIARVDPHTKALAQLFETARSIISPPDTGYPVEVADTFYQGAAYVAGGVKSPEEALRWIDEQLKGTRQGR